MAATMPYDPCCLLSNRYFFFVGTLYTRIEMVQPIQQQLNPHQASLKIHSILIELSFADGWTTDDLQYLWKPKDPVQIVPDLHLPRFTLEKYINAYCNIKTNTGKKERRRRKSAVFSDVCKIQQQHLQKQQRKIETKNVAILRIQTGQEEKEKKENQKYCRSNSSSSSGYNAVFPVLCSAAAAATTTAAAGCVS